jgi:CRISPR-associated protein Cas4
MARRISVSMLSSYLYCKRKLFLEYVLKLVSPEKEVLVKGSIRHETYDKLNKLEEQIVKSINLDDDFESIYKKYITYFAKLLRQTITENKFRLRDVKLPLIDAYQQILPFLIRESEIRALNLYNFIEKHNIYGGELWEKLTPKIESEFRIDSPGLELHGIIDQIEVYPEGRVPIELKTGTAPTEGVWPGHRIQLGAYALLMEEKFGKEIKEGFVYYLDTQEKRRIAINPFLKEEVKELKEKVRELLCSKEIPDFVENQNKCNKCSLREMCFDNNLLQKP